MNNCLKKKLQLFDELLKKYTLFSFGRKRIFIGEPNKKLRICRFCGKAEPDINFASRAHAISEAIGNKKVFLHDECDACNRHFSKTIEQDIVAYFSFLRTFYAIKAKGGVKPPAREKLRIDAFAKPNLVVQRRLCI